MPRFGFRPVALRACADLRGCWLNIWCAKWCCQLSLKPCKWRHCSEFQRRADFVVAGFESGGSSSLVHYLHRVPDWARDFNLPPAAAPSCDAEPSYWRGAGGSSEEKGRIVSSCFIC
eukprot:s145_g22.t3